MHSLLRRVGRGIGVGAAAAAVALSWTASSMAQPAVPSGEPMSVHVDATDLNRRILAVRQALPVQPGPLKLWFARWLPGQHGPNGDVSRVSGLRFVAGGQALAWRRDPLDSHAFLLDVPAGVRTLEVAFQQLTPLGRSAGRRVVTDQMINLQWHDVLLYPAGLAARDIPVRASLTLPAGWQAGTALRPERTAGAVLHFMTVSLDTLVDSPVFAGQHLRRVPLDEGARPVTLVMLADDPAQLKADEGQLAAHRKLVEQADRLFGSRPFGHYDFLFALTERLGGVGLEHHQSSENAVRPGYFKDWDKAVGAREQLAHEYVHAWNGKYRRPAGLATPHFNAPMQNTLLWVYEGQTEFWGKVLAARAGLVNPELARDDLAQAAADMQHRAGRTWRNLQDTVHDEIMNHDWYRDWRDWQRLRGDYYTEGALIWLDADALIRELSGGTRSLDDFAGRFFGGVDGDTGPRPYDFDDVVAALNAVQPHDWAGFLRERVDAHDDRRLLDGLQRAGWRLAYTDTPSANFTHDESRYGPSVDLGFSLGLRVGGDGRIQGVRWDSPAFKAGLVPESTISAVNAKVFKPERLKAAVAANKDGQSPIELIVTRGDDVLTVKLDYRGGLRYPSLQRIEGRPDLLTPLLTAR
jgi:predicted metalloprotease with PDZ domain